MSTNILENFRIVLDDKRETYTRAVLLHKEEGKLLKTARRRLVNAEEARVLIQDVAQAIQQKAHHQIAAVVSRGLQAIFDEPYIFQINFEKKRGRTEAQLVFKRDEIEFDPITASGGGVIDIAAFTLRVACLALSRPAVRPVLILDEPFKNVSKANGYLDKIPEFLEGLSQDMGIQIIMVTHIEELKVGKIVEIGIGKYKIEEVL